MHDPSKMLKSSLNAQPMRAKILYPRRCTKQKTNTREPEGERKDRRELEFIKQA